jgi:Sulfotransferase family
MNSNAPSTGHDQRTISSRIKRASWRVSKKILQTFWRRGVALHVFVAGMQRSGTNLVMDILDASVSTQVFHETDPATFAQYEMRDIGVIRSVVERCATPVFVIKSLCELDRISFLMNQFPPAKTLWIVRDWRDSAKSAIKSFGNFVPQWLRLAQGEQNDWRGRGMSESTRGILRRLYRSEASEAEGAAIMWFYRNILFFEQRLDTEARVRLVFYEDLVREPVHELTGIYAYLDLPGCKPGTARHIHARSVEHARIDDIAQEVRDLCDGLMLRFEELRNARA